MMQLICFINYHWLRLILSLETLNKTQACYKSALTKPAIKLWADEGWQGVLSAVVQCWGASDTPLFKGNNSKPRKGFCWLCTQVGSKVSGCSWRAKALPVCRKGKSLRINKILLTPRGSFPTGLQVTSALSDRIHSETVTEAFGLIFPQTAPEDIWLII